MNKKLAIKKNYFAFFRNSAYPHAPQTSLSLWLARKNPVPHFGQLLFFRTSVSPFFSKSFQAPVFGGPFFAGAAFPAAGFLTSAMVNHFAAGAFASAFTFFFGSTLSSCSFESYTYALNSALVPPNAPRICFMTMVSAVTDSFLASCSVSSLLLGVAPSNARVPVSSLRFSSGLCFCSFTASSI